LAERLQKNKQILDKYIMLHLINGNNFIQWIFQDQMQWVFHLIKILFM